MSFLLKRDLRESAESPVISDAEICEVPQVPTSLFPKPLYHSLAKKDPWVVHIISYSDKGDGWIFVTFPHFTTKRHPFQHSL